MTIFDYINNILFTKKENCFSSMDDEKQFSSYLLNRWLSMYGKQTISSCQIANKYLQIFPNKTEAYKFFSAIFPKVPFKKITYIKKTKTDSDSEKEYQLLAKNKELSVREIKNYIDLLK